MWPPGWYCFGWKLEVVLTVTTRTLLAFTTVKMDFPPRIRPLWYSASGVFLCVVSASIMIIMLHVGDKRKKQVSDDNKGSVNTKIQQKSVMRQISRYVIEASDIWPATALNLSPTVKNHPPPKGNDPAENTRAQKIKSALMAMYQSTK